MSQAWFRRILLTPLMLLSECILLVLSPVLLVLFAFVSALVLDRRMRVPRALILGALYLALDLSAFAAMAVVYAMRLLRLSSAADTRRRGFNIARGLLHRLYRAANRLLGVRVIVEGEAGAVAALDKPDKPLIVLSRHDGPGDAFLLVHELFSRGRCTRVIVRAALQADPGIDALGHALSFCFVRRGHGRSDHTMQRIAASAHAMQGEDAMLLFPEGGNVTEKRVRRGIATLLREGRLRRARQAARLRHLAAPYPGGVNAALRGAESADVLFIAHTGLAGMHGPVWRWIPIDTTMLVHVFVVPRADVPATEAAQAQWLFDWWQRMDAWVDVAAGKRATQLQVAAKV